MDKGDCVLVLSFLGFLGFLAFLALSNKSQSGYVVAPNYVQVPPSLGERGNG